MPSDAGSPRPVQLHVIHDLGGGSSKWLADFCRADAARVNLVLKPVTVDSRAGRGLALYANPGDEVPLQAWRFRESIPASVEAHAEY